MAKDATYGITPHQLVDRVAPIARDAIERRKELIALNRFGGIEWGLREQLRTAQGHYQKIDDVCSEIIWGVGSDYAANVAESIWGPVDTEI